jgi:PhnB protein
MKAGLSFPPRIAKRESRANQAPSVFRRPLRRGHRAGNPEFKGISLSLSADSDAQAKRCFEGLADGGEVVQPLMDTFFATSFGMANDRFGVSRVVPVPKLVAG